MKVTNYEPGGLIIAKAERDSVWPLIIKICVIMLLFGVIAQFIPATNEPELISPCPKSGCEVIVTPAPTPIATPEPTKAPEVKPVNGILTGLASWYGIDGCLGCSATLTMANGEKLDDSLITVAYNDAPLNSMVQITNLRTGAQVTAKVTDRGGFKRHGKIIDLSVATKNALGCGDVCKVEVKSI